MSQDLRNWIETAFNLAYLAGIWGLVAAMARRRHHVAREHGPVAWLFLAVFALLALGDTGHVGFRVLAFAGGGLEQRLNVGGLEVGLVGAGALATAVTVTFFYAGLVLIWQRRFAQPLGVWGWVLLAAGVIRLVVMAFPENNWNSTVPPQPWSLYRNLPLMVQGLGVAALILRDAFATRDRVFQWLGALILVSYAFYIPVILWVQAAPAIGMLMIPKTLAYVAMAVLAYRAFFLPAAAPAPHAAAAD